MKISIVIPCYNAEHYLRECLDSIMQCDSVQVEIICVDDFSTDNTISIVETYCEKHDNIILIKHAENKGTLEARRSGSFAASGDYILYVDPDDRLASGGLKKLAQSLEKNSVDILCFGHTAFGACDDRKLQWNKFSSGHLNISSREHLLDAVFRLKPKMPWSLCVCAWRRELIIEALNEMPYGYCVYCEDGCMFFVLCNKAQRVNFLDSIIYEYRVDSGITSHMRVLDWDTIGANLRSLSYIVRFGSGECARAGRIYWAYFEMVCVEAIRSRIFSKLKRYDDKKELLREEYFSKDNMAGMLYLIMFEQERTWERRMNLLKPFWIFKFLLIIARSCMGLRKKLSNSEDAKIHYQILHDEYKFMAKLISSKG